MGVYMPGTSLGVNLKVGRGIKGTQKDRGVERKLQDLTERKQQDPTTHKQQDPITHKQQVPGDRKRDTDQSATISAEWAKQGKGTLMMICLLHVE